MPGVAFAGNGNTLYLLQDGTDGSNSFLSDQSHSDYSSIGTLSSPAVQRGQNNSANVTIASQCASATSLTCGFLSFTQNNSQSLSGGLLGNTSTVSIKGFGSGSVQQIGDGNDASLTLTGSHGEIYQRGMDNTASLKVSMGATGSIYQSGSGNYGSLKVTSTDPDAMTSLSQVGSGLYYDGPVSVATTTSVAISQFKF